MRKIYGGVIALNLLLTQCLLTGSSATDFLFPLSTWDLFGAVPLRREVSFLYLEDLKTGNLCYFYLCPRLDKTRITPYHPYGILRSGRERDIIAYFEDKIDITALNYRVHIKKENTTMRDKWKELSRWIKE